MSNSKKLLLAGLLVFASYSFVTFDWVTVKLDDRASVQFPSDPNQSEMGGNPFWVQDVDKNSRCMAMIIDYSKFGMDSAGVVQEINAPESFDQFKAGVLAEIPGSKLIDGRKGLVSGKTYFEFVVDMGKTDTSALNIMYTRSIFVGSRMYTLNFYEKNKLPRENERKQFLESFKLGY